MVLAGSTPALTTSEKVDTRDLINPRGSLTQERMGDHVGLIN